MLLLLLSARAAIAQTLPPLSPPIAGFSFPTEQILTYGVDWRVFPAGVATFHLQQVGGFEHITATGASVGALNLLFRVDDRFESYVNRETGCSTSFSKQLEEGHRRITSSLRFLRTRASKSSTKKIW